MSPYALQPYLRVAQERDAEAVLAEVGEAVAGDLEAGEVVARRVVRRPAGDAERGLVRRLVGVHGERERGLEETVVLVPVGDRVDLEAAGAGVEADGLAQVRAGADRALEVDLDPQRILADGRDPVGRRAVRAGLEVERVDVPGVPRRRAGPRRARGGWPAPPAPRGRSRGARGEAIAPPGVSVAGRCAFSSTAPPSAVARCARVVGTRGDDAARPARRRLREHERAARVPRDLAPRPRDRVDRDGARRRRLAERGSAAA